MLETIMYKSCSKCKESKPISEFYKDRSRSDGVQYVCKDCNRAYEQTDARKAFRRIYRKTQTCRTINRRYDHSEKGKARSKRRYLKDKQKYQARNAVNYAVAMGTIPAVTTMNCGDCGESAQEWHHTHGYRPGFHFHIRAVCVPCHARIHSQRHKSLLLHGMY